MGGRSAVTRPGTDTITSVRAFAEGSNHTLIKRLDAVLLLEADSQLQLDNCPDFENIILDLLDIHSPSDGVTAGHFFNVGFQLADITS